MDQQLRADARRNRTVILASASALFAERGHDVQMGEIAAHAGLGIGSLYRHFPNKQALLTAIVQQRFQAMAELAREAEEIRDPFTAFEAVLRRYLEAAEADKAFQWAMLGSDAIEWAGIQNDKDGFAAIATRVIDRATAAGVVRADLIYADFPVMTCGVMSTMYFQPGGNADWRRHLTLLLQGLQAPTQHGGQFDTGPTPR